MAAAAFGRLCTRSAGITVPFHRLISLKRSCTPLRSLNTCTSPNRSGVINRMRTFYKACEKQTAGPVAVGVVAVVAASGFVVATCDGESKEISFISSKTTESALAAKLDHYGGVIVVDAVDQCASKAEFESKLTSSVACWKSENRKGIWLQLPSHKLEWAQMALDAGFEVHHAEKDHIMLTLWIPADLPNTLPGYTSHTLGVGAVVINDKNEILIVQENSGPASKAASGIEFWKYPTGLVDAGENAMDAAVREVKEETGIDAEIVSFVCMRETHSGASSGWMSGKTNVFLVFLLRPTTSEILTQQSEIAMAKWVPIDDYFENMTQRMPVGSLYHEMSKLALEAHGDQNTAFDVRHMPLGFRSGTNTLYSAKL
eukprot:m.136355 g.136355  ORF g.136355 m.136355 type:complete len:372 (+) comp29844_c1_seq1:131-1246(+)